MKRLVKDGIVGVLTLAVSAVVLLLGVSVVISAASYLPVDDWDAVLGYTLTGMVMVTIYGAAAVIGGFCTIIVALSVVEIASGSWQAVRHPRLPRWCGGQHVPVGHPRRWAGQRLSTFGNVVFVWPALIVRLIGMGIVAAGCWYVLYRGVESVVTTLL